MLLQSSTERLDGMSRGVVLENCCTVRKKLQGIFRENTVVKLDIFHAIQRILKSMRSVLLKDLRLCFRQESDSTFFSTGGGEGGSFLAFFS